MNDIIIRELEKGDIKEVSTLLLDMWLMHAENNGLVSKEKLKRCNIESYLLESIKSQNQLFLIAENKGGVIATIRAEIKNNPSFYNKKKQLFLDDLIVKKGFRGKGLASRLIKESTEFAKSNNVGLVTCKIYEFNQPSQGLAKKLGLKKDFSYYSKEINGNE